MGVSMGDEAAIHIMGAGLSGLAAATLLARAGKEVHVHDVRADSGSRFDGDFQALENWSMDEDFFDQLKSRSQGYASLDYELSGYRPSDLVRVDILLNALPADAFSTIVHRDKAYNYGNRMCGKLRELIPRQMFDVPIQAAIGGRIIARETVKARRKDVLAKCYGGDISRKRKLLEKQKEGKKKMKSIGRVEVPGDVFISALKLDD